MAKKITITGSEHLTSLDDEWGGINNSEGPINKYGTVVPAGAEWGMNRGEVERFIKTQFKGKFGDFRTTEPDERSFIHLLCFATTGDANLYDTLIEEHPEEANALVVKNLTIPIPTISSDSYLATLATSRSTSTQYLVKDGDSFEIPLRLNVTHTIAATNTPEPLYGIGRLTVQCSVNGTSWENVIKTNIDAVGETSGYPTTINMKGLLSEGRLNYIRISASFPYTDNEGVERTAATTPIIISVTSVTLGLSMNTSWRDPIIDPSDVLSLSYNVSGSVAKTFHLKVTGSAGTYTAPPMSLSAAATTALFNLNENNDYGLTTHGIKTCEAWLEAGNENTGFIESEHLQTQVMVVRSNAGEEVYMKPRLILQKILTKVVTEGIEQELLVAENFVQTRLLSYAIYSPIINEHGNISNTGPAIPITFILNNSADNIVSNPHNIYTSMLVNPSPGTTYDLDMTVEIENDGDVLNAFLHVTRNDNGVTKDFLAESTGQGFISLRVDNSGGFQPTANSTFLLNPKTRNNSEDNPKTILNMKANNALVQSRWDNFKLGNEDGYIKDDDGESCLRVPAGRMLSIEYNPFASLISSPNSSINIEFDLCIRNVTNEDDPVLQIAELVSGVWRGLRMRPMIGYMTTESWNSDKESDFRWQEDVRTHFAINIVRNVYPNAHGDALVTADKVEMASGAFPLVRVFINGIINREFVYSPSADEFCTGPMSNGGIIIGQGGYAALTTEPSDWETNWANYYTKSGDTYTPVSEQSAPNFVVGTYYRKVVPGADIDIYGIRVWQNSALTPENVLQDYISTLPSSTMKRRMKTANSIINPDTGLVDLDLIVGENGIHRNALVWHGNEAYHENGQSGATGWIESWRYDNEGNYIPELSGTVCRETKSIPQKNQGTTAKTYYYHNLQWDIHKANNNIITLSPDDFHDSITKEWVPDYEWEDSEEVGAWKIKGGYLGKDFPHPEEKFKYYHGTANSIQVPDGWIDGNGKYRGIGYQVSLDVPMFQKGVNKINYASSMQSHLIGINWLYNDLHTAVCGNNTMQNNVSGAVVAKHTEPFLFFTQGENDQRAVFRGPCAYGAGKMDKPSWGYVKSKHADFCMIEGADNDKQLTDMRVPWDDEPHGNQPAKVFYDPDQEAWYYRLSLVDSDAKEKCIDFDGGATDDSEYPKAAIVNYIRAAWNFLYLHAPRIRHYDGTLSDFMTDAEWAKRSIDQSTSDADRERILLAKSRVKTSNKYWCHAEGVTTQGDYLLKRYDYAEGTWVDAGLWNENAYEQIDLRYHDMTAAAWTTLVQNNQQNQSNVVNKAFIKAIVMDARNNIGNYFKESSLKFHYAFENHFIAGTDNCSKNTYYVLDPVTHLFELHQDDVDTTLATDNSGLQSKPYYIDRMHPFTGTREAEASMSQAEDLSPENCSYEGYYNVLFDLCELMWEPNDIMGVSDSRNDIPVMLNNIFKAMASLTGGIETEESENMVGVWRALNKYIFGIQRYFPATAYNEAARIRYELPELIGFSSDVRDIRPITQSMGDQLQAELQFLKRRLVYMASYAAFGEFTATGIRGGDRTGLEGAGDSFGMTPYTASNYVFKLVPHQWIYPTGSKQTNNLTNPHVRVAPGATNMPNGYFELDLSMNEPSDQGVSVLGLNYYRELGNVGDMVAGDGVSSFRIDGRRLIKFVAEPTVSPAAFRVGNIVIGTATRLKEFNVNGASIGMGTLDLSKLMLCETIDTRGTEVSQVRLPETSTLTTLQLPSTITTLRLENLPSLESLSIQGYSALSSMIVKGCPLVSTLPHVIRMQASEAVVYNMEIDNIDWQTGMVVANTIRWLLDIGDRGSCKLSGRIQMAPPSGDGKLEYDDVVRLISRYGDIYDSTITVSGNGLYVYFSKSNITNKAMSITGRKYIRTSDLDDMTETEGVTSGFYNKLALAVSGGNNVAARYKGNGVWVPDIEWSIDESGYDEYAKIENGDVYSPSLSLHVVAVTANVVITIRATLTDINGNHRTVTKKVGLWNRIPQVGDFAWTDGEFDNENDPSKKLSGMVIMRQMLDANGNVTTDISECVAYKLWIYGAANSTMPANNNINDYGSYEIADSNVSTQCWGLFPKGTNGTSYKPYYFDDAKSNGTAYDDPMLQDILEEVRGKSFGGKPFNSSGDIFNTPLSDLSGDIYLKKNAAACTATNHRAMQDTSNVANNGWNVNSDAHLNNFDSEGEKATLMAYADAVLAAVLRHHGINNEDLPEDCVDSEGNVHPRTRQALSNLMQIVMMYCAREELSNVFSNSAEDTYAIGDHVIYNEHYYTCTAATTGGTFDESCWTDFNISDLISGGTAFRAIYPSRYRELLFPAARLADTWCPADATSINEGLTEAQLDDQYKRGKWMLPSSALLARIYNFLGNSRPTSYTTSEGPSETMANESDELLEAEKPLFANAMARGRSVSVSYSSGHWSGTETNRIGARYVYFFNGSSYGYTGKYLGTVVRPVAAFTFVP